jgi:RES domain-containing protein
LIYPPEILDALQHAPVSQWAGTVFRHMFADYPPDLANTRGARWNPPDVAAIYASLALDTALTEAEHRISLEPFRPRVRRTIYEVSVELSSVLELTSPELLASVGIGEDELQADVPDACQMVGGAVAWLDHDGMLVPSARAAGTNIVIFPNAGSAPGRFDVIASHDVSDNKPD